MIYFRFVTKEKMFRFIFISDEKTFTSNQQIFANHLHKLIFKQVFLVPLYLEDTSEPLSSLCCGNNIRKLKADVRRFWERKMTKGRNPGCYRNANLGVLKTKMVLPNSFTYEQGLVPKSWTNLLCQTRLRLKYIPHKWLSDYALFSIRFVGKDYKKHNNKINHRPFAEQPTNLDDSFRSKQ